MLVELMAAYLNPAEHVKQLQTTLAQLDVPGDESTLMWSSKPFA